MLRRHIHLLFPFELIAIVFLIILAFADILLFKILSAVYFFLFWVIPFPITCFLEEHLLFKERDAKVKEMRKINLEDDLDSFIDCIGIAITDLRPIGKIEINQKVLQVKSDAAYIPKGSKVKIKSIRDGEPIVKCI